MGTTRFEKQRIKKRRKRIATRKINTEEGRCFKHRDVARKRRLPVSIGRESVRTTPRRRGTSTNSRVDWIAFRVMQVQHQ